MVVMLDIKLITGSIISLESVHKSKGPYLPSLVLIHLVTAVTSMYYYWQLFDDKICSRNDLWFIIPISFVSRPHSEGVTCVKK